MSRPRLLLADRIKQRQDSFLAPLLPALEDTFDIRFLSVGPGDALAEAIAWSDIVWLEWCWDHAVWATRTGVLAGKPAIVRLHSIEALQTDYPCQVDWSQIACLITVSDDIAGVLRARAPAVAEAGAMAVIPNGIDMDRFVPGRPDRFRLAWVGHLEPKKNPMLLLQIAQRLRQQDPRYAIHVAGAATDLRTGRYINAMVERLGLRNGIRFHGQVADMPSWYADKGVLLSTSMYESFGLNIGEAMACGAFPVVHAFPGAESLWPTECLFAGIDEAVALIRSARCHLYRDWVADRYSLRQQAMQIRQRLHALLPERADRIPGA